MEFLGIQISIWHGFIVEWHTGVAVFVILALVVRFLTDVVVRGRPASPQVTAIRVDSDIIAYFGAIAAVVFLILSGITGYLIEPYSVMVSTPILLNKSLTALAALYFWGAFAFIRWWCGPGLWERRGLYALALMTALLGILFTALAGSIGAELSPYGQSIMDPVYKALSINFHQLTLTTTDVEATAVVFVLAIIVVAFLKPSHKTA